MNDLPLGFIEEDNFSVSTPNDFVELSKSEIKSDEYKNLKNKYKKYNQPLRHAARTGSRITETILGFPGDVGSIAKSILPESLNEITNAVIPGKKLLENLPTTSKLKNLSETTTEGYTSPQSSNEEFGDEVTSLATSVFTGHPSLRVAPSATNLLRGIGTSIGKSLGVKSVGKVAKALGASENTQKNIETGALFLTGFLGQRSVNQAITNQYQRAHQLSNPNALVNTRRLYNELQNAENVLTQGLMPESKRIVLAQLRPLLRRARNGNMTVGDLTQTYRDLNEIMGQRNLFQELNTTQLRNLRTRFNSSIRDPVNNALEGYGRQNPNWYREWRSANQAYAANAEGNRVREWLMDHSKPIAKALGVGALTNVFGIPHVIGTAAAGGALGATASTGYQFLNNVVNSPVLRRHYIDLFRNVSQENLPGAINIAKKIEKEKSKQEELKK